MAPNPPYIFKNYKGFPISRRSCKIARSIWGGLSWEEVFDGVWGQRLGKIHTAYMEIIIALFVPNFQRT